MQNKHVELYQLFIAVILVVGAIMASWTDVNSRIAILESKQTTQEAQNLQLIIKIDEILKNQMEVLIKLENKKNR